MAKETIKSNLKILSASLLLLISFLPTLCFAQDKLPITWAYATSTYGSYSVSRTYDNKLSTYWRGQNSTYWWLSFNLKSSQPLSKISIYWHKTSGSTQYQILGSNDNQNFTPISGILSSAGGSTNPQLKEYLISGTYRYVAIEIFKAQNNRYPIIYEVELYGGTSQDTTAPTGTIKINNGTSYTSSSAVTLNLTATDSGSGMGEGAQMQFSNDNSTWTAAEAYATTKSWTLPSGDGQKTVYVKFSDAAGNWSEAVSDQIILDATKPTTPIVTDDGVTTSSLNQLHARWSSSDTTSGIGEYQYLITQDSTSGTVIIGWTSVGTATEVTKTGLNLTADKSYYFAVRAKDKAGLWSNIGYTDGIKAVALVAPQAVSITPSSGSGPADTPVDFTTLYSDGNGYEDLTFALLLINTSINGSNGFYGYYNRSANRLYLRNNAGNKWLGGFAPGSGGIIQNSYAKIDCSKTTVSGSGDNLSINWNITFKQAFNGTKKCYLYTKDNSGAKTGWKQKGSWSIGTSPVAPQAVSITPSSGSGPADTPVDFTTLYSDGNGYEDLTFALLLINTSINGSNGFYGYYNRSANRLYLRNNAGNKWLGGFAPGSGGIIQNSYAKIDCSKTTVSGSGDNLSINWNITFKQAFNGTKKCYLYTKDNSGAKTGWKQKGTWIVGGDTTPPVGIIKINNGDNYTGFVNVTLNLQAEDEEGGSGLDKMQFSNDNINWSTPEDYADSKTWDLFADDGDKTVYVKYSDAAGNWSEAYQDNITLDTVSPQISSVAPVDGSFGLEGYVVSLYVGVDDNNLCPVEYQYSIDGQIVQSWLTIPFYHWNSQGEGIHAIKFEVRDLSGEDSREVEIYLAKEPIQPPY